MTTDPATKIKLKQRNRHGFAVRSSKFARWEMPDVQPTWPSDG